MADFRRNRKTGFGGRDSGGRFRRDSGGKSGRRDFDRPDRGSGLEMHEVTCFKCGKQCEVPFKPNNSKPVYCSDCFRKEGGAGSRDRDSFSGPRAPSSGELEQINLKLDKILKALKID